MDRTVTALFWDVGGVVLSNGWDEAARAAAALRFHFDLQEMERRHAGVFAAFETGQITLDAYLDQAVFFEKRLFTRAEFSAFVFAQSRQDTETRALLDDLTAAGRYFLATLNNEGRELNEYRIREFNLTRNFTAFCSSCYLGVRKPDAAIYRRAMGIAQRAPDESVFIDDRPENVEGARRAGMRAIHFQNPQQLRAELARQGVVGAKS